jgi:hypothetical protein
MILIIEAIYQMLGPNTESEDENAEKRVEMIFNHLDTVGLTHAIPSHPTRPLIFFVFFECFRIKTTSFQWMSLWRARHKTPK